MLHSHMSISGSHLTGADAQTPKNCLTQIPVPCQYQCSHECNNNRCRYIDSVHYICREVVLVIAGRCRDIRFQTWHVFLPLLMCAHADEFFGKYSKLIWQIENNSAITTRLLSVISTCCCSCGYRGLWDMMFQTWPVFFMLLLMCAHADVQFQEYSKIISQHVNDIAIITRSLSVISTCCCSCGYSGLWDMMFQTWPVFSCFSWCVHMLMNYSVVNK